ncbi:MAG: zinc-ribbon domain-containing protein [Clostridia bacterium]|nr:zinc-ribbon domain-containing protein [Clostridia bacterium]
MARFCNSCGKPVQDGYAFCNHCGKPLPKIPAAPAYPTQSTPTPPVYPVQSIPTAPVYPTPAQPIPQPKKSKWWIGLIAGATALVVLLACLLPKGGLPNNSQSPLGNNPPVQNGGAVTDYYQPVNIHSQPVQDITRTVMIYIVGSDLETDSKAATLDIQEMVDANIDTSKTRVLFYTGGAAYWHHSNISANQNAIYLLEQDTIKKVDSTTPKNMAEASTLTYFLNYCVNNYPSDRYSLILWDHGGGPLEGYGLDEKYRDMMSVADLQSALSRSPFGSSNKLEMLGFDACLMASAECAWAFRNYAEYYVASEELEPGYGWNYLFLENLPRCQNGAQLGQLIIDTYFDFYDELCRIDPRNKTDLTLSCVNLSRISTVEQKVNALFSGINTEILNGKISEASRCRYRSKTFGKSSSDTLDLIDLGHIATLLTTEYPDAANALLTALKGYVTYSCTNTANAHGVSIYHPYENTTDLPTYVRIFNSFNFAKDYAVYIDNFANCVLKKSGQNTAYRDLSFSSGSVVTQENRSDLSLTLTQEQMATFAGAEYYVFYALDEDTTLSGEVEYLHVFSGQDCTLSKDGVLSATYEGKAVFALEDGEYTFTPLAMNQIYDGSGEEKFYFPCTFTKDNFWSGKSEDKVNWMMKIQDGKPLLTSAYLDEDEDGNPLADKVAIDSEDYDRYSFLNYSYTFATDPTVGTQLYYTGYEYGWTLDKGTFELALRPLPDRENYYAVFAITDIYGNRYFSDVTCLGD